MTHPSPLTEIHKQAGASIHPFGPPELGVELVEFYDHLELEYAALRKRAALLDQPHRATIRVKGPDAGGFLNNMLTQELKTLSAGASTNSFWLSRQGRIEADLRVIRLEDEYLFDLDVFAAARTIESLGSYIIMEDVELIDETQATHRLALHGPKAGDILASLGAEIPEIDHAVTTTIVEKRLLIDRRDTAGVPGYEIHVGTDDSLAVWSTLAALAPESRTGEQDAGFDERAEHWLRPSGFHAWNTARIEARVPVFNLDFGTDSLPAETGVLNDRVSFEKGCYLGQEVVARMQALGHPKRVVVPMVFESVPADPAHPDAGPLQPVTGSQLRIPDDAGSAAGDGGGGGGGDVVGGVSSSTLSPMRGSVPIALATVKWGHHEPGTALEAEASGSFVRGTVEPWE